MDKTHNILCKLTSAVKKSKPGVGLRGFIIGGFTPGLTMKLSWWQAEERLRSIPDVRKALEQEELGLSDAW